VSRGAETLIACSVMAAVLVSCGDSESSHPSPQRQDKAAAGLSRQVSAWSDATTSYYTTLLNCGRQPSPVRGYLTVCTRQWRLNYERVRMHFLRALRSEHPPSQACASDLLRARSLAAKVQKALKVTFGVYSASLDTGRYHGLPTGSRAVGVLLGRADRQVIRSKNVAPALTRKIQNICAR
jgi:hypothetical protein